MMKVIQY